MEGVREAASGQLNLESVLALRPGIAHGRFCRLSETRLVCRLADERSGPMEVTVETIFRITATGYGTNVNTTANLQTMFRRE